MAPPVEENRTRRAPERRHRLEEHQAADDVGARVADRVRDAVAQVDLRRVVRDEVDLLLAQEGLEVRLDAMSARTKRAPSGSRSLRPEERSSTITTRCPSARCRFAMWEPMNPAPPVTRMFIESFRVGQEPSVGMIAKNRPDPRLAFDPRALRPLASRRATSTGAARSASRAASSARGSRGASAAAGTARGSSRPRRTWAPETARPTPGRAVARPASSRCTPTAGTSTSSSSTACTSAPTW